MGALEEIATRGDESEIFLTAEFCYLQVRRICELLALGVLAAHNSLPGARSSKLYSIWNPDKIFRNVSVLNEMGFPVPFRGSVNLDRTLHFTPIEKPLIDAAYLGKMYARCGENLHVGKFSDLLTERQKMYDIREIRQWCGGLAELLSEHMIMLPEFETVLVATLDTSDTHEVSVFIGAPDLETYQGQFNGMALIRAI